MPLVDQHIRLSAEQLSRLRRAVRSSGQSQSEFIRAALLKALDEQEAKRTAQRPTRKEKPDAPGGLFGQADRAALAGSGSDEEEPVATSRPDVGPLVVVQQGNPSSAPSSSDLGMLAAFVVQGPHWNRGDRLRQACDILRASSPADQLSARARQLDAEIDKLEPKRSPLAALRGILR